MTDVEGREELMAQDVVLKTIRFDLSQRGDPDVRTTAKRWYQDSTGVFASGFWSAQWGRVDIHYEKDEFCTILEGEVRVTDSEGNVETYREGDSFVIPNGFKGVWETVKPVRKFYATYTPPK